MTNSIGQSSTIHQLSWESDHCYRMKENLPEMVLVVVRPGVIWRLGGLHETFTDVHIFIFRCAPIHWLIRLHETFTIVLLLTLRWAPSLGLDPCNYKSRLLDRNDLFAWIQLTILEWSFCTQNIYGTLLIEHWIVSQCPWFSLKLKSNNNVFKVSLFLFPSQKIQLEKFFDRCWVSGSGGKFLFLFYVPSWSFRRAHNWSISW